MIGALLNDRYRLDAELGRGGMGVVYRARDTLLVLGHLALAEGAHAEAQDLLRESAAVYREIGQREVLGLALDVLGVTACGLEDFRRAGRYLSEALRTGTEEG